MIDLGALIDDGEFTTVTPSNRIFEELGKNTYDYKDVLSELIDNSVAGRRNDRLLVVEITVYVDEALRPIFFEIKDNAAGIPTDRLGLAITPAGLQGRDSLNEHGLGMKQAVAALGKLDYLATRCDGEASARVVREFSYGDLRTYRAPMDVDSGTVIVVKDLKPIVSNNSTHISRTIVPYLGARYRRYLRPDNPTMRLSIGFKRVGEANYISSWIVDDVKPIYFHPSTRRNAPVISNFELRGHGWKANLTFGYAPDDSECAELGLTPPNKFHPYHVSLSRQGLDVILHDRIILFHQLSELGIVSTRHPNFNMIRGEVDLSEGFSTAITKNSIIADQHFSECLQEIKKVLSGKQPGPNGETKDYLRLKTYPEAIPEDLLRDRLAEWLRKNPLQSRQSVETEFVVQGIEGFIDILADQEVWELKPDQASALDVYQLYMYLDVGGFDVGFLVAKDFSTGANVAARHIRDKHQKTITLARLEDFPILQQPTDKERADYY